MDENKVLANGLKVHKVGYVATRARATMTLKVDTTGRRWAVDKANTEGAPQAVDGSDATGKVRPLLVFSVDASMILLLLHAFSLPLIVAPCSCHLLLCRQLSSSRTS